MDVSVLPSVLSQEGTKDEAEQISLRQQKAKAWLLEQEVAMAMETGGKP